MLYLKAFLSFFTDCKDMLFQYGQESRDLGTTDEERPHIVGLYNMMGKVPSEKSFVERTELLTQGIAMAYHYQQYAEIPSSIVILIILLAYQGRFQEAEEQIEAYSQTMQEPFPGEMLRITAWIGLETERGNFREVLNLEKQWEPDNPFINPAIYSFYEWRLALAHGMLGNFKESLQRFEKYLNTNVQQGPNILRADILLARIQVAIRMEEPETALFYLDQVDPQPSVDHYIEAMLAVYAGWIYMHLNQLEDAAEYLEKKAQPIAKRLRSTLLDAHFEFALAKLHWLQTMDSQFIEAANKILNKMAEEKITGYYEFYREDLQHWAFFLGDSSSELSTAFGNNKEINQLMEVNRKITATLELESVFDSVLEGAMTIVGAEHGYLFTYDNDFDLTNPNLLPALKLTRNAQGDLIRVDQYAFSKTVVRTVLDSNTAVVTRDARHEKRWYVYQSITERQLRSILATPIMLQGEIKGILYLDNHQASAVFSFKDKEIVDMFATQAAIALNNAQVYEREQAARQQTEATLKTFELFVPRQFTDRFAEGNIENLKTGLSQEETLSILFSDIRSFTTLSESMSHDDIFQFLNAYLLRMEAPIRKHGGFVDKFIGDAIMALFDQSPQDAILAGLDMLTVLADYNTYRVETGKMPVSIGIGINTGEVMLGVIGSQERTDTTVLGDAVNVASRIEALTKYYGTAFLISGETYTQICQMEHLLVRKIDEVQVKGKEEATQIYEIYNHDPERIREKKQRFYSHFQQAFQCYQQGYWSQCEKLFEAYLKQFPEDQAAVRFIERAQLFIKMPPSNWTGVYSGPEKFCPLV